MVSTRLVSSNKAVSRHLSYCFTFAHRVETWETRCLPSFATHSPGQNNSPPDLFGEAWLTEYTGVLLKVYIVFQLPLPLSTTTQTYMYTVSATLTPPSLCPGCLTFTLVHGAGGQLTGKRDITCQVQGIPCSSLVTTLLAPSTHAVYTTPRTFHRAAHKESFFLTVSFYDCSLYPGYKLYTLIDSLWKAVIQSSH